MDPQLLDYYEAIERASADMLGAARDGRWDDVLKLESACVLLISQLKHAAQSPAQAAPDAFSTAVAAAKTKSRIMQRILVNDAEIRHLAEPWLQDLEQTLAGRSPTLH
ncbi:MAG: flagellar protein FliT [Rubrivivax sp.]